MIDLRAADLPDLPGALCVQIGGDVWFPDEGEGRVDPIAICGRCPVRDACLAWALEHPDALGIWGGTTEGKRRHLRKRAA